MIKGFDVIEEEPIGFSPGSRDASMKAFGFESSPERFHGSVIIAVGYAAHTLSDSIRME